MAGSTLIYNYVCSNGSGMALHRRLELIDGVYTLWNRSMGRTVVGKKEAEKELCEEYQSVILSSFTKCETVTVDKLIQG